MNSPNRLRFPLLALLCGTVALAACAPTNGGQTGFDPAACDLLLHHVDPGVAQHTTDCGAATCGNDVNPPTGGLHCGTWLNCHEYTTPQPRCKWIHNTEHGHVVFAYNCPSGCPDVVTALESLRNEVPAGTNGVRRAVITPDPLLPHRIAVVTWGWSYSADELDEDAIRCLISKHDLDAYEHLDCDP